MPFPNFIGSHRRYWTREKVLSVLRRIAAPWKGNLPCSDDDYLVLKRGRLDWPTIHRIYEYFGSLANAWLMAGAPISRVSFKNIDWDDEMREYIMDHAGKKTLPQIGKAIGRTGPAVRKELQKLGLTARANQGFLSAAEIAVEYECSVNRVCRFCNSGKLKGKFDKKRNRWQVDPSDLTEGIIKELKAPRITHKTGPVDKGDYYARYNIRRHLINGKMVRVEE